jgi:hypothetical protein
VTAFVACQWLLFALNVLCCGLAAFFFVKQVYQSRCVGKEAMCQATVFASSIFGCLVYGIDPFRFIASANGYLTSSYRAGLTVLTNLNLALICCGYAFVTAGWISIQSRQVLVTGYSVLGWIVFAALWIISLVSAGVCAALWLVFETSTADTIFYIILLVLTVFIIVVCFSCAFRALAQLRKFRDKNTTLFARLAWHTIWMIS